MGRDHSETCERCGFQRGGIGDVACPCQLPWAASLMASRDHWKAKHKDLTTTLLAEVTRLEGRLAEYNAHNEQLRAELAKAQSAAACTGCSVPLGDSWCAQCASAVNEARLVTLIEAALVGPVDVPDDVSAEVARMVRAVRINVVMRERHAAIVEAAKAWRAWSRCDGVSLAIVEEKLIDAIDDAAIDAAEGETK